jgi:hypothetical protein
VTVDSETDTRIPDTAEHVEQSITFWSQKQELDLLESALRDPTVDRRLGGLGVGILPIGF